MLTSVALGPGFRRVLFRSGNARVWSRADGPRSGCRRSCDVAARAQELSGYECRSAVAAAFGARQEISGSALPDSAPAAIASRLKITEIFLSVQGESSSVGWPTVFVRLTGCPLRCPYCDTAHAFHCGQWQSPDALVAEVARPARKSVVWGKRGSFRL